jgi:tetratricopeptide (TPR) repeat protein
VRNFYDSKRHRIESSGGEFVKPAAIIVKFFVVALICGCFCAAGRAQNTPPATNPASPQKPAAGESSSKANSDQPAKPAGTIDPEAPSPPVKGSGEIYDPYHAAKSLEVGKYYMRKGDIDAAIERFKDAIHYKYDFAIPRILLGEAYEKKHEDAEAIRYYKEYLKILPDGPDAKHAKERIEKLSKRLSAEK